MCVEVDTFVVECVICFLCDVMIFMKVKVLMAEKNTGTKIIPIYGCALLF